MERLLREIWLRGLSLRLSLYKGHGRRDLGKVIYLSVAFLKSYYMVSCREKGSGIAKSLSPAQLCTANRC
jgi:hypothetical protein